MVAGVIPELEARPVLVVVVTGISTAVASVSAGTRLGSRRDEASVPALVALLGAADAAVARSAALALGAIHAPEAARGLQEAKPQGRPRAGNLGDLCLHDPFVPILPAWVGCAG